METAQALLKTIISNATYLPLELLPVLNEFIPVTSLCTMIIEGYLFEITERSFESAVYRTLVYYVVSCRFSLSRPLAWLHFLKDAMLMSHIVVVRQWIDKYDYNSSLLGICFECCNRPECFYRKSRCDCGDPLVFQEVRSDSNTVFWDPM